MAFKTYYSPQRIKQIIHKYYDYRLEVVGDGYKANRKRGYVTKYNLIQVSTGEVVLRNIPLRAFDNVLREAGYPLHDEKSRNKKVSDSRCNVKSSISGNGKE